MAAPSPSELDERLAFAVELAREAGALALERFRAPDLDVELKRDGSPVTEVDRAVERLLRERIAARWPDDGVLGEEEDEELGSSGRTWIVDPIDGTESYRRGVPLFCVLVGVEVDGDPVLGVVAAPGVDELVAAAKGRGARWWVGDGEPRPARVSDTRRLEDALVLATSSKAFGAEGLAVAHARLVARAAQDRGWSDAYAHLLVATGRADAAVEPRMSVWDNAALLPILEEAGGRFTDLGGKRTIRGGSALATNGRLHGELLEVLSG